MKKLKIGTEVYVKKRNGSKVSGRVHSTYERHGSWVRVNLSPKGTRDPELMAVRPCRLSIA